MGNCSNISNTQTVTLASGTLTSGFCHNDLQTTYEEFTSKTTGALGGNMAAFTAGDDTPASGDQDKLWMKQDASTCVPEGWHWYNGSTTDWELAPVPLAALADGAVGTVLYHNGTSWVVLSAGTDGQHLKSKGAAAPEWADVDTGSHHYYITRSTMASGSGGSDVSATSVSLSTEVAAAASATGWTPSVAIVELYSDVSTSPTGDSHCILKVGNDSSMSRYAYVEARNRNGSRNDAANTSSPTNQASVPLGGSSGSETLHYSVDTTIGLSANWKWDLVGFVK
jgi:hypothetical protein